MIGSSRPKGSAPWWRRWVLAAAILLPAIVPTAASGASAADTLRQSWTSSATPVGTGPANALRVESAMANDVLSGLLLGVMDRPFDDVRAVISDPAGWCALLILDPNVHACRASGTAVEATLGETSTPVKFTYAATGQGDGHVGSRLFAVEGPLGTRDYAVTVEAAPLTPTRTLVQLTFTQRFGVAGRMAMAAYFATSGRKKVGFTVVSRDAEGKPVYIGDLRGGIERNLARYFLAIEANASSRGVAPAQQPEARVRAWLAGTERYPRQLAEGPGFAARKVPEVRKQMTGE